MCYPVVQGDSATTLAFRLTKNARSWRDPGFQILDSARRKFIPKAEYGRIYPGWQACVDEPLLARGLVPSYRLDLSAAGPSAAPPAATGRGFAMPIGSWGMAVLCAVAVAVWVVFARWYAKRTRVIARTLETFGTSFIQEFERPLLEERDARPPALRAQLSLRPRRRSLDVLLAPNQGRSYPNLADHRANVEYDVQRVMLIVDDRRFVCGLPETRGEWVRVPIRLLSDVHKEGGV